MSKDLVIKLLLPEDLYNKLSLEAQKRTLPLSTHLRLLLIEHVGGTGWNAPQTTKEEEPEKAAPKLRAVHEKWRTRMKEHTFLYEHPPMLEGFFGPIPPTHPTGFDNWISFVFRVDKYLRKIGVSAEDDVSLWTSEHIENYENWKTDPADALCDCVKAIYARANPE